jgi:hypothetical protein
MDFCVNALTQKLRNLGSLNLAYVPKKLAGMYIGRTFLLHPFPSVHGLQLTNLHSRDISVCNARWPR